MTTQQFNNDIETNSLTPSSSSNIPTSVMMQDFFTLAEKTSSTASTRLYLQNLCFAALRRQSIFAMLQVKQRDNGQGAATGATTGAATGATTGAATDSNQANLECQDALLDLQSWWQRIQNTRKNLQLERIIEICYSLSSDIQAFHSVHKEIQPKHQLINGQLAYIERLHEIKKVVDAQTKPQVNNGLIIIGQHKFKLPAEDKQLVAYLLLLLYISAFLTFARGYFNCRGWDLEMLELQVAWRHAS